jgi:hypothetical protein
MNITHDSYYTIGSTHQYCQDYADSGAYNEFVYACISDGCSSSKDSDIGARWLCKSFPLDQIISKEGQKTEDELVQSIRCAYPSGIFGQQSLDATLLGLVYDKTSDQLRIYAWGDGQIHLKYKDGRAINYSISYKSNAPYYLSYRLSDKTAQYEKEFGLDYAVVKEIDREVETSFFACKNFFKVVENASKTLDFAAVMSDGIESFMFPLSLNKQLVQNEFLNFKSLNGEFVKRRFQGFKRFCARESVSYHDDLSLAAISFVDS